MILYGSSISPFVRKVLAVAGEKGVEITLKPVGVGDRDPEFREASPLGKMPALRDDDYLLADSSAIVYGCSGSSYRLSDGATSTIAPRYMTAMSSLM
mgnify:CR=1 FL=1